MCSGQTEKKDISHTYEDDCQHVFDYDINMLTPFRRFPKDMPNQHWKDIESPTVVHKPKSSSSKEPSQEESDDQKVLNSLINKITVSNSASPAADPDKDQALLDAILGKRNRPVITNRIEPTLQTDSTMGGDSRVDHLESVAGTTAPVIGDGRFTYWPFWQEEGHVVYVSEQETPCAADVQTYHSRTRLKKSQSG